MFVSRATSSERIGKIGSESDRSNVVARLEHLERGCSHRFDRLLISSTTPSSTLLKQHKFRELPSISYCQPEWMVVESTYQPGQTRSCPKLHARTMYTNLFQYFGLRENAFHVSPDPRFFFSTGVHASALAELSAGVDSHQGLIVLIGEAGTGKTILLHKFLNWLRARRQSSSYIFQSQLKPLELFEAILRDFGAPFDSRRKGDLLAAMSEWLIHRHSMGDSPVLVIDEAQAMSLRTLDRLRMLLNLEMPGHKLLQIVLAGQPQLEEKLRRPELLQLRQRVMFRCTLPSLSLEETAAYVKHRLTHCGAAESNVFPPESLEVVHIYAQGIPRVVNLLCEHALITAYAEKSTVVTPDMISRVAMTFELTPQSESLSRREAVPQFAPFVHLSAEDRNVHVTTMNTTVAEPISELDEMACDENTQDGTTSRLAAFSVAEIKASEIADAPVIVSEGPPGTPPSPVPVATRLTSKLQAVNQVASLVAHKLQHIGARLAHWLESSPRTPAFLMSFRIKLRQQVLAKPAFISVPGRQVATRFLHYWVEVGQSFVHDCKHFTQSYTQTRKVPGTRSSDA